MGSYQLRSLLCNIYKNNNCKIEERYYNSPLYFSQSADESSPCVVIDPEKCILCGECVRTCHSLQGVGALEMVFEKGITHVRAKGETLADTACVGCGQCHANCPTGALRIKSSVEMVREAIADPDTLVVAQIAPSVRVGVGELLGFGAEENSMAKIVGGLKKLGFDKVHDTVYAADLTAMEEGEEFLERLKNGEKLPLLTSCCPAWVKYCEEKLPRFKKNISSCRSPQQMLGAVLRRHYEKSGEGEGKRLVSVSIMPCTAKKAEILREESHTNGKRDIDFSLTTSELLDWMDSEGLDAANCPESEADAPFRMGSGGGTLFGVSGGVAEAVLRFMSPEKLVRVEVKSKDGETVGECVEAEMEGERVRIAVVSGLKNAKELLERVEKGEESFHLIEVMACPGGCLMGGGQPVDAYRSVFRKNARHKTLCGMDERAKIKAPQENEFAKRLREELLAEGERALLHRNGH